MTANKILEIELELKKNGLTNLGIAVFKKKFLQKYEVALLIGPNEPFFWDNFKKSKEFNSSRKNPLNNWCCWELRMGRTSFSISRNV